MRMIRSISIGVAVVDVGLFFLLWFAFKPQKTPPLLSGPPEFLILAIVIAFGAYLRQIAFQADEFRIRILSGDIWKFPPEEEYGKAKAAIVARTSQIIRATSPFMIGMVVLVCIRIVFDSWARMFCAQGHFPTFFYPLDISITIFLFFEFLGLAIAHFVTRSQDGSIEALARADEERNLASAQSKSREFTNTCDEILAIGRKVQGQEKTTI